MRLPGFGWLRGFGFLFGPFSGLAEFGRVWEDRHSGRNLQLTREEKIPGEIWCSRVKELDVVLPGLE